jgi:hypothetical protein
MWFDASKIRLEPPANPANSANRKGEELEIGRLISRISEISNHASSANDDLPILVECWTPSGIRRLVEVDSEEQGEFVHRMNPKPPMVTCGSCAHGTVAAGIARCGAGVDSGLATGGWWATDRHQCQLYEAKP